MRNWPPLPPRESPVPHGVSPTQKDAQGHTRSATTGAPRPWSACCWFPCQPTSTTGARQGARDAKGRGLIVNHTISALAAKRPRAFLLENVKGLATQHRATFENILQQLRQMAGSADSKYSTRQTLASHKHRERVFIVAVLRAARVPGIDPKGA